MFKKISIGFILPIFMLIGVFPTHQLSFADSDLSVKNDEKIQTDFFEEEFYLWSEDGEEIPLYDDYTNEKKEIFEAPHKSLVLLSNDDDNIEIDDLEYIRYIDKDNGIEIDGYVKKKQVIDSEEFEEKQNKEKEESKKDKEDEDKSESVEDKPEKKDTSEKEDDSENEDQSEDESQEADYSEDGEENEESINNRDETSDSETNDNNEKSTTEYRSASQEITGVAKKAPTNVREKTSTKSKVIKQLHIGEVIDYHDYSKNWNQITVRINGKDQVGYIHKKHVTNVTTIPQSGKGVAKKSPTNIRTGASTKSKVAKKLHIGEVFDYKTFSKNWNEVTFTSNGEKQTGYIHKKHFTSIKTKPKDGKGVAKKSPTNIRAGASTESKVAKKLHIGEVFDYKTFSKNWNEVTFNSNGEEKTGYIHKKHFTNIKTKAKNAKLVTKKSPTNVRAGASTKSNVLLELSPGEIIDVKTFSKNWYEFNKKVDGKKETGYIHKKHVEDAYTKTFQGTAKKKKTRIRTKTSTNSDELTIVPKGTIIDYKLHNDDWYKAIIEINGKSKTGYIHKKHIEEGLSNQKSIWGIGLKQPTNVRSSASTKSKVLTTFDLDEMMKLKPFTKDWYKVDVTIDGTKQTGYIHRKHVDNIDGETFKGVAKKKKTYIRTKTSTKSSALKTVSGGTIIKYQPYSKNWYSTTVKVNGKNKTGYIHKKHITPSAGYTVFLDAGHGGSDPGASGYGLQEKTLTLDITKRVQKILEDNGFNVIMSRTSDKYPSLKERTDAANKSGANIFVSIHINSGGGTGIETWNMSDGPKPKESDILANQLQKELIKETKETDRGVKDGNLHVNRESQMPSSLVEIGFIDNKADANKLKTSSFKQKVAKGISEGIKSYFGRVH